MAYLKITLINEIQRDPSNSYVVLNLLKGFQISSLNYLPVVSFLLG